MVAVKGRRIEPSIRVAAATVLAEFDDIVGHLDSWISLVPPRCQAIAFVLRTIIFGFVACWNCVLIDSRSLKVCLLALTLAGIGAPTAAHAQSNAAEGQKLAFDRAKGNCLSCHEIKGGDLPGTIGPALKDIKRKYPDRNDLIAILTDETRRNPQTAMPPFGRNHILTEQEIDAIVDFLQTL
jgi:sulfur-oxidizing protein SoxX